MTRLRPALSALVLAGGAARRMGGEKARRRVGPRTLLERSLLLAAAVADETLLLAGPRGQHLAGAGAAVRRVPDWTVGAGPLRALGAGLEAAAQPWCLCLACDMPFVTPDVVALLAAAARRRVAAGGREPDAVLFRGADGWEPFPGLFHRRALPRVRAWLVDGGRSFQGLLDTLVVREADLQALTALDPGLRCLRNVNTPSDLRAARAVAAEIAS